MSHSKPIESNFVAKALNEYSKLLQKSPVLTKALTSAFTGALGNFISQMISRDPQQTIKWRSVAAYALFGFLFTGPLTHHFYRWLETTVPRGSKYGALKKIVLDRFVFAPPYLLLFFYVIAILEGTGNKEAVNKIGSTFWDALKMNWRVWTIFQYINVNYVPQQYRVLFGNVVALGWTIYLSGTRK